MIHFRCGSHFWIFLKFAFWSPCVFFSIHMRSFLCRSMKFIPDITYSLCFQCPIMKNQTNLAIYHNLAFKAILVPPSFWACPFLVPLPTRTRFVSVHRVGAEHWVTSDPRPNKEGRRRQMSRSKKTNDGNRLSSSCSAETSPTAQLHASSFSKRRSARTDGPTNR